MEVRTLTWNLFHGRDAPPDPALWTWRSRLLKTTERGPTHAQVNVDLFEQFADLLAAESWDVALLQECPPRFAEPLATACRADPHLVLTSRNIVGPVQGAIARLNPDLLASWEGGANLTLARGGAAAAPPILERRQLTIAWRPERRRLAFTRLRSGLCVANMHLGTDRVAAEREVLLAAETAEAWSSGAPLLFGGDLNLRPRSSPELFERLERSYGLRPPTAEDAIDHLLVRGCELLDPPTRWPAERREVPDPTGGEAGPARPVRLSDHAPVEALIALTSRS